MSQEFPDVPFLPGVPAVMRESAPPPDQFSQPLTSDGPDADNVSANVPVWGVLKADGSKALTPTSFKSVEIAAEWLVSDYPQEEGAFQSYNKVQRPFDVRLATLIGGSDSDRADYITAVQALIAGLDLLSVVTPDATFKSVNLTHYDYRKTDREGVTLLTVELWFKEIRVTATAQFTNTATPEGAAQKNDGAVQPQAPPPANTAAGAAIANAGTTTQ